MGKTLDVEKKSKKKGWNRKEGVEVVNKEQEERRSGGGEHRAATRPC